MKKQLDTISHLLVHFEEFSGIRFSWNFVNVVLGECVDHRQLSHDNVFCRLVKKSPGKWPENASETITNTLFAAP